METTTHTVCITEDKMLSLFIVCCLDELTSALPNPLPAEPPQQWLKHCKKAGKWFAKQMPEFGKTGEWYLQGVVSQWQELRKLHNEDR